VPRFGTVLVANRGEIAVRVLRSASTHGLRSVAVYSDADRTAPHVRAADVAVRIGPAPAARSYLDIDAILSAAERSGADAIHPGYGFMSERADFARAVVEAGLVFIGPPASVMAAMGRKDQARDIAARAGVPVVPNYDLMTEGGVVGLSGDTNRVDWPVLVKAVAGGGGKGMRVVGDAAQLSEAVEAARREARAAFGDDALLFERYLEHGRHIEVQVIADEHGNVLHLYERDCSVQRRHQKVIEEAPAARLSERLRGLLTKWAVDLAREVGYVNAGTVEFLVAGGDAYFLEMNTRLQVEHPVTEAVTGVDLVGWQFGIAQGDVLPIGQEEVECRGHSIEARVYAEDAFAGYLPQAGRATVVRWPVRARVDAALESGQVVGTDYDPMLGKVIVSGEHREAARRALVAALDESAVLGLTTNLGFLRQVAASAEFRDGDIDTSWLDTHPDAFGLTVPTQAWAFAAWTLARQGGTTTHPFGVADGWRLGGEAALVPITLSSSDECKTLLVGADRITSGVGTVGVRPLGMHDGCARLEIDGEVHDAVVAPTDHDVLVAYQGQTYEFTRPDAFAPGAAAPPVDGSVDAPMPGTVLRVTAAVGDQVRAGDQLGVLEAMKMELALTAPVDGVVSDVACSVGDRVGLGVRLFVVNRSDSASTYGG
jgi:3-methylcrotonyl-CoA carboxylase alpha subunit/acetyl-CoA/propionyl-CoA carboxylase biotin carboxyl carrier protein